MGVIYKEGVLYCGGGGSSLPDGGTTGQALVKKSNTDQDVEWSSIEALPSGGTQGQVLTKKSSTDGDADWEDIEALPSGGTTGQVLTKKSSTDGDAEWSDVDALPSGGTQGQVLTKQSSTDGDADWNNLPEENQTITLADFNNLTPAEKNNGTAYFVTDVVPDEPSMAACGFTPIGTIIAVMGNSAPANYLACNGQIVNITDYPELAKYFEDQFGSENYFGGDGTTTFGIPDLRGEFLRGTGTNSHANQGSGANVGTHQDATEVGVSAGISSGGGVYITTLTSESTSYANADSSYKTGKRFYMGAQADTGTNKGEVDMVRPTNTSVLYCIATHNIYVDAKRNYSTDEAVVGTWIDGKPLYQKTFSGSTTGKSSDTWNNITIVWDANTNTTHYIEGTYYVPGVDGGIGQIETPYIKTNLLGVNQRWTSTSISYDYNVTIQYTKTTD